MMTCDRCHGSRRICEAHQDQPWPHGDCAGPGEPCPLCNDGERPEMPGFVSFTGDSRPIELDHLPPDPPPPIPTREALWAIARADGIKVSARLLVRGAWGFEAQILHDGVLFVALRFDTRDQAERWTEAERKTIESNQLTVLRPLSVVLGEGMTSSLPVFSSTASSR